MLRKECAALWQTLATYDTVVIGAGPAGFGAAVAAARRGLKTALIEQYGFAGGVATKSCVPMFFNYGIDGKQVTAGLAEEFARRMDEVGSAALMVDDCCEISQYEPLNGAPLTAKVQFQPERMKWMYRRMLEEAGVDCIFYTRVCDAVTDGDKIEALLVSMQEGARLIRGKTFIDCTGDALVCALADPESVVKYSDEFNMHKSMFFYVGGVTPFDKQYNMKKYHRLYSEGKVPGSVWNHFGYSLQLDPGVAQIAVCYETGDGVSSLDLTRMDGKLRENVYEILDFLRREMPGFAQCYLLSTALQVGVRAGQGILGVDSVTEETVYGEDTHDCVALTNRSCGAHSNVKGRFTDAWGQFRTGTGSVPMGALIPKRLANVLCAGRAISTEPQLISAFRMMSTCMVTGEACGLMAYLAHRDGTPLRALSYAKLLPLLRENRFILPNDENEA